MLDKYTLIHDIFIEAIALPPEEYEEALRRLCKGDKYLEDEVRLLLEASKKTDSFLESPLIHLAFVEEDPALPTVAGYKIENLLGVGGMAVVYKARQLEPDRIIALKFMRKQHGEELALRFQAERETLARMNHPWIAQIYGVGSSDDGTPFFSMEYVEGCSLTDYCINKAPSLEQRLELFLKICSAMQHAHGKLIIHRDLKPTNILVDESGNPKIIDFGIARVLESRNPAHEITVRGGFVGTPIFMSPEQTQLPGSELDVRTDVYSLGALLYLILTGLKPFARRAKDKSLEEVFNIVRTQSLNKPSLVVDAEAPELNGLNIEDLLKNLKEDLDWVLLKSLAKDREERYSSVGDLAADLKRFLDHRPVLARDSTGFYRFKRFVRRYQRPFWLSAAAITLIIGACLTSTVYFYKSLRAERKSASYDALFEEMMTSMDPRQDLFLDTSEHLDLFSAKLSGMSQLQPEVEAILRARFGTIYLGLGQYARARTELEKAAQLSKNTLGPTDKNTLQVAYQLGMLALLMNENQKAHEIFADTHALQTNAFGARNPATLKTLRALLDSQRSLGNTENLIPRYRELLNQQTSALGADHSDTLLTATNLANCLHERGDYKAAEENYRRTYETQLRVLGDRHPYTLNAMSARANNLFYMGRYAEALEQASKAFEGYKEVLGPQHSYTLSCANNLANGMAQTGHENDAMELYNETLAIRTAHFGEQHIETLSLMNNLADLYLGQGKLKEAREIKDRELAVLNEKFGPDHKETLFSKLTLAEIMIAGDEPMEAVELLRDTCQRYQKLQPVPAANLALAEGILGYALFTAGDLGAAEEILRKSHAQLNNGQNGYLIQITGYLVKLANSYERAHKPQKANAIRDLIALPPK